MTWRTGPRSGWRGAGKFGSAEHEVVGIASVSVWRAAAMVNWLPITGRLAQRLAQVPYTHKVGGSNPSSPTMYPTAPPALPGGAVLFAARPFFSAINPQK